MDIWYTETICEKILTCPYMRAVPADGGVSPVSIFISVDLPAPLCPSIQVISFSYISNVIPGEQANKVFTSRQEAIPQHKNCTHFNSCQVSALL